MPKMFFAAAVLVLAAGAAWGQVAPLATDTPAATPSGATFTAPKDWTMAAEAGEVVLTAPEKNARIAIVEAPGAVDAKAAAAEAWRRFDPASHWPLKLVTARPARQGWDERAVLEYETSPNEHADVEAAAVRKGSLWVVTVLAGSDSTVEKRGAAVGLTFSSLRPKGYSRESFAGREAHRLNPEQVAALRDFVAQSLKELGVPGAGVALVDHGTVVFEDGVGVRALGDPTPVDAHTLFMIASNTKGMSTLLLARLADQGKLAWDQPVTQVYPTFRLGSDETTKKVLMRHLVCACTGLPRKDFDWIFDTRADTPASATFVQLAATEPTSGFGEVFQYNNLMASAAGYIGGHLVHPEMELGAAYDAAMREQIFAPLGMDETTFDMTKALGGDHASPHGDDIDGRPTLASMAFNQVVEPYRPAGGAWSSAHDLIKYVQDEISQGVLPNGQRLVSAENLLARRKPNVATGEDGTYGMGLETDTTWGVPVIHHGGSMAGFKSDILLVPDAQVGAVIVTNADNGQLLLRPFMRRLLEVLYDGKPEAAGDVAGQAARIKAEEAKARERLVFPPAPAPAAALAGAYASPELGSIKVVRVGPAVTFDFGLWKSRVASRVNDDKTISFITTDPSVDGFEFVVADRGGKRALITRDGQHEYAYVEAP